MLHGSDRRSHSPQINKNLAFCKHPRAASPRIRRGFIGSDFEIVSFLENASTKYFERTEGIYILLDSLPVAIKHQGFSSAGISSRVATSRRSSVETRTCQEVLD